MNNINKFNNSFEKSDEYDAILIKNIFNEIEDEIKENIIKENIKENIIKTNEKIKVERCNNFKKCEEYDNLVSTDISDTMNNKKNIKYNNKININEYIIFLNYKKNYYKKIKKEYTINYINKYNIKKFYYDDMATIFKQINEIIETDRKCLLCNKFLSLSFIYLNEKQIKRKKKKIKEKESLYCECFEHINYKKKILIPTYGANYFVDMIDFFDSNDYFINFKTDPIFNDFKKAAKELDYYKYKYFNATYFERFNDNKKKNLKKIKAKTFMKKPKLSWRDIILLKNNTKQFIPFIKLKSIDTNLTWLQRKFLLQCLKLEGKMHVTQRCDNSTIVTFCYLCNLHNVIIRLIGENTLCFFSKKHFQFYIYNIIKKMKKKPTFLDRLIIRVCENLDIYFK